MRFVLRMKSLHRSGLLVGFSLVLGGVFLAACGPKFFVLPAKHTHSDSSQNTTVLPPAPLAIHRDQFVHQKPSGPVDVVFVVDHTSMARLNIPNYNEYVDYSYQSFTLKSWFHREYNRFTAKLVGEPPIVDYPRELNFRVGVVTTPGKRVVSPVLENRLDRLTRLAQLKLQDSAVRRLVNESGPLLPFSSTQAALSSSSFAERSHVPLFVVYLLAADSPMQESSEQGAELIQVLDTAHRERFQTHVVVVSKTAVSQYQHDCRFSYPERTLSQLQALDGQRFSLTSVDLCDLRTAEATWPERNFAGFLYDKITMFTGGAANPKYTLSQIPKLPELMQVKGVNHRFQYGGNEGFTYDPGSNSIQFGPGAALHPGDLIEVMYYLTSPENALPGGSPGEPPQGPSGSTGYGV